MAQLGSGFFVLARVTVALIASLPGGSSPASAGTVAPLLPLFAQILTTQLAYVAAALPLSVFACLACAPQQSLNAPGEGRRCQNFPCIENVMVRPGAG